LAVPPGSRRSEGAPGGVWPSQGNPRAWPSGSGPDPEPRVFPGRRLSRPPRAPGVCPPSASRAESPSSRYEPPEKTVCAKVGRCYRSGKPLPRAPRPAIAWGVAPPPPPRRGSSTPLGAESPASAATAARSFPASRSPPCFSRVPAEGLGPCPSLPCSIPPLLLPIPHDRLVFQPAPPPASSLPPPILPPLIIMIGGSGREIPSPPPPPIPARPTAPARKFVVPARVPSFPLTPLVSDPAPHQPQAGTEWNPPTPPRGIARFPRSWALPCPRPPSFGTQGFSAPPYLNKFPLPCAPGSSEAPSRGSGLRRMPVGPRSFPPPPGPKAVGLFGTSYDQPPTPNRERVALPPVPASPSRPRFVKLLTPKKSGEPLIRPALNTSRPVQTPDKGPPARSGAGPPEPDEGGGPWRPGWSSRSIPAEPGKTGPSR